MRIGIFAEKERKRKGKLREVDRKKFDKTHNKIHSKFLKKLFLDRQDKTLDYGEEIRFLSLNFNIF
jgi:hypothetical protein